jgi:heme-degrading monooxygenase HmoA
VIAKIWRGATKAEDAEAYAGYLDRTGVSEYRSTEGNRGVLVLRTIEDDRAEFTLVSLWESMDAVRRFAGDDPSRAVFYPDDDAFLVDRDLTVRHYDVVGLHLDGEG